MTQVAQDTHKYRYSALQVAVNKYGKSLSQLSEDKRKEAENIAYKQYEIQSRILSAKEASQVAINEDQLDQEVANIVSRYPDSQEFYKELADNELSITQFRHSVDRELRVQAVMDLISANVEECSETDARIYYYLHPEKFHQPETRDASHILITENPEFPENCRDEAIARATSIAKRLQKKPSRFSEQAMKYSECPTAMQGGELGRVKKGVLFPTLEKKLFSMKPGSVSDVVESPLGFHVLYCKEIHGEGPVPLSVALPTIIEKITDRNKQKYLRSWIKNVCESV